jgi:hypothetical protein
MMLKDSGTERHWVKCFSPGYQGPVLGYHLARTSDGKLNDKAFEQVNGQALADIDFVASEGKAYLAATTWASLNHPRTSVWLRETSIKAIQEQKATNADWKVAPWAEGCNVWGLRGSLKGGAPTYSFLNTTDGCLMVAALNDKTAKVNRKNVKGVLTTVSGAVSDPHHMTTIFTADKIIAIGNDDTVIADFGNPNYAELGRLIRQASNLCGILGKNGAIYASSVDSPLTSLTVAKTWSAQA